MVGCAALSASFLPEFGFGQRVDAVRHAVRVALRVDLGAAAVVEGRHPVVFSHAGKLRLPTPLPRVASATPDPVASPLPAATPLPAVSTSGPDHE